MKRTVILLTEEQFDFVKEQSKERGCTTAQVLRDLIRDEMYRTEERKALLKRS